MFFFFFFFLQRLDQKLRDNFRDARNNLFTQDNVRAGRLIIHRPILIIADRGIDLATMLHHTWTYQALIHDLLVRNENLFCKLMFVFICILQIFHCNIGSSTLKIDTFLDDRLMIQENEYGRLVESDTIVKWIGGISRSIWYSFFVVSKFLNILWSFIEVNSMNRISLGSGFESCGNQRQNGKKERI